MDIQTIDPKDLDALFGSDAPKNVDPTKDVVVNPDDTPPPVISREDALDGIEDISDILNNDNPPNPDSTNDDEPSEDDDTNDDTPSSDDPPANDDTDDNEPSGNEPPANDEPPVDTPEEVTEALKNTVNYLVEQGIWEDFDGRDSTKWDNENYAKLAAQQEKHKAEKQFEDFVGQTGKYGKAIFDHIKKGGNPDEIISIFKEEKELETIDTSTPKGKLTLLNKYYSEVMGWKPEKVHKHLSRVIQDQEVEEEVSDVQDRYESHYARQRETLDREAEKNQRAIEEQQQRFEDSIKRELSSDNYTENERRFLEDSILKANNRTEEGEPVNDFYIRFVEMQKDPKDYLKLVQFVMDPEGYDNKKERSASSKTSKHAFEFIKGNSAAKKTTNSTRSNNKPQNKNKRTGLDWSNLL